MRWLQLNGSTRGSTTLQRGRDNHRRIANGMTRELSDDEFCDESEDEESTPCTAGAAEPRDTDRPWLKDFSKYLHETEELDTLSIVHWWGVSIFSHDLETFLSL